MFGGVGGLIDKFNGCTPSSGTGGIDGLAYCFWDFDTEDSNGVKKIGDFNTYNARPIIKEQAVYVPQWGV